MKKKPLISIITPVFNREKLIVECIKSVQEQEYKNYEHIIIDDCSSDNTAKVVESFAKKDNKIILLTSAKTSGGKPGKVRNVGIRIAKGELVAFLDSDDLWKREKIRTQLEFMQENELDFSYHPLSRLVNRADATTSFWGRDCFQRDFFRGLFLSNFIPTCSVLVKKKVLKEVGFFEETLEYSEDYFLWMLIALKKYKMAFLSDVLGSFRRTNHGNINSVLNKKEKHANDIFLKEKIIFEYKDESIPRLMKSDLFYKYIYYYYELIKEESSFARKKELLAKVFDRILELNLTLFFVTELELLAGLRKND
ncbi:glycosyltransferase [bacterium]|nr:MAG: glycosyltransferase [bacterium]